MEPLNREELEVAALLERSTPGAPARLHSRVAREISPARRQPAWPLRVAVGTGFAALAIGGALIGLEPFDSGEGSVQADRECRIVQVTGTELVPRVAVGADGRERIVYDRRPYSRPQQQC